MKLDTIVASFNRFPRAVRAAMLGALVLLAVCAVAISIATHAPRTALFATGLHAEQLAEVEERLAEWSVPFTPAADNVIVDTSRRNELLLRLSLAGVPRSHVATTNETLSQIGMLTPQSVIDAQARNGLAGDIESALRTIDGVDDARVIIAPAKAAEFSDESGRDASASVRLQMHAGAVLSTQSIAGIRQFVAASVAGLDPSHVTILDDRGVALTDTAASGGDGDTLQRALQSALDAALGSGATIVRVHVEYDRAATERRETQRAPLAGAPIERQAQSESYNESGKHYERRDEQDDRGSQTREIVIRRTPGTPERVSTAVFVDASRADDLARIRELAAATVGYDERRGDALVVEAVDFHRTPEPKHDAWFLLYGAIVPLLPALALAVAVIVLARTAMPELTKTMQGLVASVSAARTAQQISGFAPSHVRGVLAHEPPHAAAAVISALPAATAAAVLELYPAHEREAIVRRMQRAQPPFVPDAEELFGRHA
jgi:flagellar M-ring protein FliF